MDIHKNQDDKNPCRSEMARKRFSTENWKIIESLKRERKELKIFNESQIRSDTDYGAKYENKAKGFSSYSLSICSHTACRFNSSQNTIPNVTNEVDMPFCSEEESKYIAEPEAGVQSDCRALSFKSFVAQFDQGPKSESTRDTNVCKVDWKTLNKDTKLKNSWDLSTDSIVTLDSLKRLELAAAEAKPEPDYSPAMVVAIHSLLEITTVKRYFQELTTDKLEDKQGASLLSVFSKLASTFNTSKPTYQAVLHELKAVGCPVYSQMQEKSSFRIFRDILEILHIEILDEKKAGKIKRRCTSKCFLPSRESHSVITHTFRGHYKRKVACPMGHINIITEPFTCLSLPVSKVENKSMIVPVISFGLEIKTPKTTMCLLNINQWTTVSDLKQRLDLLLNADVATGLKEFVIASVKQNDILAMHDDKLLIFDVICHEGELTAFDVIAQSSFTRREGYSKSSDNDTDFLFTSTPAVTDVSDTEQDGDRSSSRTVPVRIKTRVPVSINMCSTKGMISFPCIVKLPKVIDGKKVVNIFLAMMGLNIDSQYKMHVSLKNAQTGCCRICSDVLCAGCNLNTVKYINIKEYDKISITTNINAICKKFSQHEVAKHVSLTSGCPSKIITVHECLSASFREQSDHGCSSCDITDGLESSVIALKAPNILVLKVDNVSSDDISVVFPKRGLAFPFHLTAKRSAAVYNLLKVVFTASDSNSNSSLRDNVALCENLDMLIYVRQGKHEMKKKFRKSCKSEKKFLTKLRRNTHENSKSALSTGLRKMSTFKATTDTTQNLEHFISQDTGDISSICQCSRCQCWQRCAEQLKNDRKSLPASFPRAHNSKQRRQSELPSQNCESRQGPIDVQKKLHRAILKENLKRAIDSLHKGADPNALIDGVAAIHLASGLPLPAGYFFTKLLMDHGANPNLSSTEGLTPVELAAMWKRTDTLKYLLENGGKSHDANTGCDALHVNTPETKRETEKDTEDTLEILREYEEVSKLRSRAPLNEEDADSVDTLKLLNEVERRSTVNKLPLQEETDEEADAVESTRTELLDLNCSTVPEVTSDYRLDSLETVLSTLPEENSYQIEYLPRSHLNGRRARFFSLLCCRARCRLRGKTSTGRWIKRNFPQVTETISRPMGRLIRRFRS